MSTNPSGTINFDVTQMSSWTSGEKYSDTVTIGNIPWKLGIGWKTTDNVQYLELYMFCNSNSSSNLWSCNAEIALKLTTSENEEPIIRNVDCCFKKGSTRKIFEKFIEKNKLITYNNTGCLQNEDCSILANIEIKFSNGFQKVQNADFSKSQNIDSEIVLIVDDHKLYVDRNILTSFSPFFNAKFDAIPAEILLEKFEIEDVDYSHFVDFLAILHRRNQEINDKNVEGLLQLAHKYDVKFLLEDCEDFLIATLNISNSDKLRLSEIYHFSSLQEETLKKLTSITTVKEVRKGIADIGGQTAKVLLDKMCYL